MRKEDRQLASVSRSDATPAISAVDSTIRTSPAVTAVVCARTPIVNEGIRALLTDQGIPLVGVVQDIAALRGMVIRRRPGAVVLVAADGLVSEMVALDVANKILCETGVGVLVLGDRDPSLTAIEQLLIKSERTGYLNVERLQAQQLS